MRRLALPAWLVGLLVVTAWLRALPTAGDPTFAAARAFALAAAAYLFLATGANVGLALCRVRIRLPLVPLLVVASLSAPLAGTPAFAVMSTTTTTPAATPPPVMHRIGEATAPVAAAPVAPAAPRLSVVPAAVPVPPTTPAPAGTWTVRRGQNFWSIAAHVTRARLGRAPSPSEIAAYWRPLIAANRDRLVRPADASLLYAGQVLVLP